MMISSLAMLNGWEIVLLLAVFFLLFGVKKLPALARGVGQSIREFRAGVEESETKAK
jgi:sec-independent protein translocase protein TatA